MPPKPKVSSIKRFSPVLLNVKLVSSLEFICPILSYSELCFEFRIKCTSAESFWVRDSEFEELEAVPTSSAIDGPLEPPPSSAAVVSDAPDESFASYFSVSSR